MIQTTKSSLKKIQKWRIPRKLIQTTIDPNHLSSLKEIQESTVSNNCTYIQNPGYPSAYTTSGSCQYSVTPMNSDICQLRLDLDAFDLAETATPDGTCIDTFDVTTGSSRDYYALCGTLTGQHCKYIVPF